jgi:hypothetical protein
VKLSHYLALDLSLLAMVMGGLALSGQDGVTLGVIALAWLAITGAWIGLEMWWRRNA